MAISMILARCKCGRTAEFRGDSPRERDKAMVAVGWSRTTAGKFVEHFYCPECCTIIWCRTDPEASQ